LTGVRLFAQAFWLPKAGSTEDEFEDAFWPMRLPSDGEEERSDFRIAIADGASETSFSALWAKLLVRSYAKGRLIPERFEPALKGLQQRWYTIVTRRPLPWYAEEKVKLGAAAALLGLHLRERAAKRHGGRWEATALGDCCLMQVRAGRVIKRFPIERASQFSNSPFLLSSNPSACEGWPERMRHATGRWLAEDCFYLMTDALAAWFLREKEDGHTPWEPLRALETGGTPVFLDWIAQLRSAKRIRNDDVTLVRIETLA
jgi:hypothetical protein